MTQVKRISARTLLLAAGTAGFVALGAGTAGAAPLTPPVHELTPAVERTLVEGVAPTVNSVAPEGVGPIAGTALTELQETAHNPDKPAPDLAAPLPQGSDLRTPLGTVPNPTPALADTVAGAQDATGLDGDPYDTIGHDAGRALEHGGHRAGEAVEETAVTVLPSTLESVYSLRESVDLPRVGQAAPALVGPRDGERAATVAQSSPQEHGSDGPRLAQVEPLNVEGPLADAEVPRLSGTGVPVVDDAVGGVVEGTVPQLAGSGLPRVTEGVDTQTAEDLVAELSRGTDLLNDLDTSDLVSIEGGTVEQPTPEGMTQHPTFMDLPGSEALPVVS